MKKRYSYSVLSDAERDALRKKTFASIPNIAIFFVLIISINIANVVIPAHTVAGNVVHFMYSVQILAGWYPLWIISATWSYTAHGKLGLPYPMQAVFGKPVKITDTLMSRFILREMI